MNNVDMQSFISDGEGCSNQSVYGDFSFLDRSARMLDASLCDVNIDDLWESAFVEDPPTMNGLSDSFDSAYKSMPFENLLTDMLMDPHDFPNVSSTMGSPLPKSSFSHLINEPVEDGDWEDDVSLSPCSTTKISKSLGGSPTASVLSVLDPAERTTFVVVSHVQENKYLETTALQELEGVMSQLNMETRICFRDALYRLAKISKKRRIVGENSCQDGPKSAESQTNAIDRTVANLMFSKPSSCAQDFPYQGSVHQFVQPCQNAGDHDKQPVIYPHRHHPVSQPHFFNVPLSRPENNNSHSSCVLSSFMLGGGMDYISGISSHQTDDLLSNC